MANIEINGADEATVGPIREALKAAEKARAIRFADAEVGPPSGELANAATRAGMVLGFDGSGAPILIDPATLGGAGGTPTDWRALASATTGIVAGWDFADAIEDGADGNRANDLPEFVEGTGTYDQSHLEFSGRKAPHKVNDCLDFDGAEHFRGGSLDALLANREMEIFAVIQAKGRNDITAAGYSISPGQWILGANSSIRRPTLKLEVTYDNAARFVTDAGYGNDVTSLFTDGTNYGVLPIDGKLHVIRWRLKLDPGDSSYISTVWIDGVEVGSYDTGSPSLDVPAFTLGSSYGNTNPSDQLFRYRALLLGDAGSLADADAEAMVDALLENFAGVDAYATP